MIMSFAPRTGKYLNVIQQCEKSISWPSKEETEELTYLANPDQYTQPLEKAHAFASKTLLDLLVRDRDLIGHLRLGSVKTGNRKGYCPIGLQLLGIFEP